MRGVNQWMDRFQAFEKMRSWHTTTFPSVVPGQWLLFCRSALRATFQEMVKINMNTSHANVKANGYLILDNEGHGSQASLVTDESTLSRV